MEDDMYDEFLIESLLMEDEPDDGYVFGLPVLMASEDWVSSVVVTGAELPF